MNKQMYLVWVQQSMKDALSRLISDSLYKLLKLYKRHRHIISILQVVYFNTNYFSSSAWGRATTKHEAWRGQTIVQISAKESEETRS